MRTILSAITSYSPYYSNRSPQFTVVSVPHISSDIVDIPVTDQDIAAVARDYLVSWEELVPHLELTAPEQSIQMTFQVYEDQKLHVWRRNKGNGATYHTFMTASETIFNSI